MNIEQIDNSRILISLADKELESYSVTFENLSLSETHSRTVLKELLHYASVKTGISFQNKKILIEALKYEHGCLLLLTVSKIRKTYHIRHCSNAYTFTFSNAENFLACIKALYRMQPDRFLSSAFSYHQTYFLVIRSSSPLKPGYINTINEFAVSCKRGNVFIAFLMEHAKLLKHHHAVQNIGKAL